MTDANESPSTAGRRADRPGVFAESFRRPFASTALADQVVDAALDLLASGGPQRITLGLVARALHMQPSSLYFRTGGLGPMLATLVETFAWRWNRWTTNPYADDGPLRFPRIRADRDAAAAWLAIVEIAAGELRAGRPEAMWSLRKAVDDEQRALRHRLTRELGRVPSAAELHVTLAAALGLRAMLAHELVEVGEDGADAVAALLLSLLTGGVGVTE